MKQKIESYLEENRSKMDIDHPKEQMGWQQLQSRLDQNQNKRKLAFWKAAAAIFIIFSIGYVVYNESKPKQMVIIGLSDLSPELAQQESDYKTLINHKYNEIKNTPTEKEQLQFLYNELAVLDTIYNSYLTDLNQSGANEQIIRALLDHYEKKVRLLDRILNETQKLKDHENNEKYVEI